MNQLQNHRLRYQPQLPKILREPIKLVPQEKDKEVDPEIEKLFSHSSQLPILTFQKGATSSSGPLKVGVVLSGGQAPGGHNVISGLFDALKKNDSASELIGFLDGPSGLIKNKFIELTKEKVDPYRNQGGFDCLGSDRTKIETPEQFNALEKTLREHRLDGLVIVGGDDSNTNAAFMAEFCHQKGIETAIVGVPKTIDGDLKNEYIEISFGFDTACKIYSEIIGNLLKDALSQKKYYFFVKMMGRSASHVTLECALQTHVNLALIGEEIASKKMSLSAVVRQVADLICERSEKGKNFGVILVPEGLLEFIPECQTLFDELNQYPNKPLTPLSQACFDSFPKEIQLQLLQDRDPHGNVQFSKIETERLLIALVEQALKDLKSQVKFSPQPLFCGYEGRAGLPTNFDSNYCYSLGSMAASLIQNRASGYMCCIRNLIDSVENWTLTAVPIVKMLHLEMRNNKKRTVLQKSYVNLKGSVFEAYKKIREACRVDDSYCCPGPIQFEGPIELTNALSLTLLLENG